MFNEILFKADKNNGQGFVKTPTDHPINMTASLAREFNPMVVAAGDNVYVGWYGPSGLPNKEIYFRGSEDNGDSFKGDQIDYKNNHGAKLTIPYYDDPGTPTNISDNEAISAGPTQAGPQMAAVGDSVYLAWTDQEPNGFAGRDTWFRASKDRGHSFGSRMNLSNNTVASRGPRLAASGDDVYVAWQDNLGFKFSRSNDQGDTFEVPVVLDSKGATGSGQIHADGSNVYAAWSGKSVDEDNPTGAIFKMSTDNGATFNHATKANVTGGTWRGSISQVLGSGDRVYVIWDVCKSRCGFVPPHNYEVLLAGADVASGPSGPPPPSGENEPPEVAADEESVTVDEGDSADNTGTFDDGDADDTVDITTDIGTVTQIGTNSGTWSWSFDTTDGPDESQTITITATDSDGEDSTATFELTVVNVAPTVNVGPGSTSLVGENYDIAASFGDLGVDDAPWDYSIKWGDGDTDIGSTSDQGAPILGSHAYGSVGIYLVTVTVTDKDGDGGSSSHNATVKAIPDCSDAGPSKDVLWPANHKMVDIAIVGVTDADGDVITINIDSIYQDEAVDAPGSGNFSPDGKGVATEIAQIRAERVGNKKIPGDGRVYHIGYTASDVDGSCSGVVLVGVPHDQGKNKTAVDGGALFDSTRIVPGSKDK